MSDNEIVAQLIKRFGCYTGDNMRRDHVEDFRGEFAGPAHRLEVVFGMNGN